jgi:hypothetical protein
MVLPIAKDIRSEGNQVKTPSPWNLAAHDINPSEFYRKFNLYANAFLNARAQNVAMQSSEALRRMAQDNKLEVHYGHDQTQYVGTQGSSGNLGRYYLSAVTSEDTLDFVHTINIAGAQ